jgi:hypothetical protein
MLHLGLDSSVIIVTILAALSQNRNSIPGRDKIFSYLESVRAGSGTHQASYPVVTEGFPVSKGTVASS